ncbi:MAG: hypothetical protein E7029_02145 [Planctomycetaceae bacterium]|nr:hypothetical protein [Planctomycetaceae bacterium]
MADTILSSDPGNSNPDPNNTPNRSKLEPGDVIGGCRLVEELGAGGYGVTWKAVISSAGVEQTVVCKLLKENLRNDTNATEEVRRVFELTQRLNHTYICPIKAIDEDPVHGIFLVMAYAGGETLRKWFSRQPGYENGLSMDMVKPILEKIADALDTIHRNEVLHRDVKPENIIFSDSGKNAVPWLIDFGIAAKIHTEESNMTTGRSRANSGTAPYMAPEQHLSRQQDARTDQYALAVMAYEFLTGQVPFPGNRDEALALKMLALPEHDRLSARMYAVLSKALNREMDQRFVTCTEFVNALSAASELAPAAERLAHARLRKEQNGGRPPLFNRRNFLLGGLGATAAALGVWRMTQDTEEPLPAPESPLPAPEEPLPAPESPLNNYSPAPLDPSENGILGTFPFGTAAGERKVWQVDGIYYAFRWCPPGTFLMGSPEDEPGRFDGETQHSVTLTRGFWMLETEVTEEMWHHVMSARVATQAAKEIGPVAAPSWKKGPDHPKVEVHWMECDEFCRKLSSQLGQTVSLPTEAQWEYACRAGTTGAYAGDLDEMGWYWDNSGDEIHPVGQKKPNAWGLYDMHGNVWEWCQDWYDRDYDTESPTSDPTGPNSGSYRVTRGGSWDFDARGCRSAYRGWDTPDDRGNILGFRPVLASPVPEE